MLRALRKVSLLTLKALWGLRLKGLWVSQEEFYPAYEFFSILTVNVRGMRDGGEGWYFSILVSSFFSGLFSAGSSFERWWGCAGFLWALDQE